MKPSVTLIFTGLFCAFILHSIWNLIGIFRAPNCKQGEVCFQSYLNSNPELELLVYVSDNSRLGNSEIIYNADNFDYRNIWEK